MRNGIAVTRNNPSLSHFHSYRNKVGKPICKWVAGGDLKESIQALASLAAGSVPQGRIEFADIALRFSHARLTLPASEQISESGSEISYSERSGLAVSGGISSALGRLKSKPTGTTSRAITNSAEQNATDAIAELDAMIGLERVKSSVRELKSLVEIDTERRSAGLRSAMPVSSRAAFRESGDG